MQIKVKTTKSIFKINISEFVNIENIAEEICKLHENEFIDQNIVTNFKKTKIIYNGKLLDLNNKIDELDIKNDDTMHAIIWENTSDIKTNNIDKNADKNVDNDNKSPINDILNSIKNNPDIVNIFSDSLKQNAEGINNIISSLNNSNNKLASNINDIFNDPKKLKTLPTLINNIVKDPEKLNTVTSKITETMNQVNGNNMDAINNIINVFKEQGLDDTNSNDNKDSDESDEIVD